MHLYLVTQYPPPLECASKMSDFPQMRRQRGSLKHAKPGMTGKLMLNALGGVAQ